MKIMSRNARRDIFKREQPFRYYNEPTGKFRYIPRESQTIYCVEHTALYQLEPAEIRDEMARIVLDANNWEYLNMPNPGRYLQAKSDIGQSPVIYDSMTKRFLTLTEQEDLVQRIYNQATGMGIPWFNPTPFSWVVPTDYIRNIWSGVIDAPNPVPTEDELGEPADVPIDLTKKETKFNPLFLLPLGFLFMTGKKS